MAWGMVRGGIGRVVVALVVVATVLGSLALPARSGLALVPTPTDPATGTTLQDAVEAGDAVALLTVLSERQLGRDLPFSASPVAPPGRVGGSLEVDGTGGPALVPAAADLMDRHNLEGDQQRGALGALAEAADRDPALAHGLGAVFAAYLDLDAATRAYLDGAPVDGVLQARIALLQATLDLRDAASATDPPPLFVDAPPAFTLDLSGTDSTYPADAAVQIDVDGDDLYRNKAGGGGVHTPQVCPILDADLPRQAGRAIVAGYLADLGGDDRYVSGYDCGTNGGGQQGAGFLYDADGTDWYDDRDGNAGWDLTVHPKGVAGSQYDDVGGALGDCPDT